MTNFLQKGMGRVIPMTIHKNKPLKGPTKIAVSNKGSIEVISVKQILYFKADSNYTEIHMVDGSKILASKTLKNFHERLSGKAFLRVHSGFIVQLEMIKAFWPAKNKVILRDNQEIPVARSKKEEVMNYLKGMMM